MTLQKGSICTWREYVKTQESFKKMLKVDRTTAARAIKKLEMNGFIEKKDDQHNKIIKKTLSNREREKCLSFYKTRK